MDTTSALASRNIWLCLCNIRLLCNTVIGSFRPKFRSYRPQDDSLKENILPEAKPGDVEAEVKDQLASANARVVIEELVSI